MMRKRSVGILMGGPSNEHEVSLSTGENVFRYMDRARYRPVKLLLTKRWELIQNGKKLPFPAGLQRFDIIFNALHGAFGEDGVLQTLLATLETPYTGSGPYASLLGMDKWLSHQLFRANGIATPATAPLESLRGINLGKPVIIKPRFGGSSVDIRLIKSNARSALTKLARSNAGKDMLVQEYLAGREFTCGVLVQNGKLRALPVIEIRPKSTHEFFDYAAKYLSDESEELVPAPITAALSKKIQKLALSIHTILDCRVYSRSDFILSSNKLYALEVNTLPGLTSNSLLPKAARAAGIPFPKLITAIIEASLR